MPARRDPSEQIDFALRRHFSAVFTEDQRAVLVALIREWDDAHPGLVCSERTRAWLAIAHEARAALPAAAVAAPVLAAAR